MNVITYIFIVVIIGCLIEIALDFQRTKLRADINDRLVKNSFDRDVIDRISKFLNQIHFFIQDQPNHNATINQAIKNYLQTQGYQLENHNITKHGQNHAHIIHYPNCTKLYTPTPHVDIVLILAKQPELTINHNDPQLLAQITQFAHSQTPISPQEPHHIEMEQIKLIHSLIQP